MPGQASYNLSTAFLPNLPGYSGAGTPALNASINGATSAMGGFSQNDRSQLEQLLGGGQNALNTYAKGAMSAAMPGLNSQLQQQQESDIRRGISTGDLGTSYEGDLYSAFQRNLSNAVAGQSMNLYGTQLGATEGLYNNDTSNYLNMMYANRNYQTGQDNAKRQRNAGLWGTIGSGLGALAGSFGGPGGMAAGAGLGGSIGSSFGA